MAFEKIKSVLKKMAGAKNKDPNFTFYLNKIYDKDLFDRVIEEIDGRNQELLAQKPFLEVILDALYKQPEKMGTIGGDATIFILFSLIESKSFQKEYAYILNHYHSIYSSEQVQKIMSLFVLEARANDESLFTLDSYIVANFSRATGIYLRELKAQRETKNMSAPYMKDTSIILNLYMAYMLIYMNIKFKKIKNLDEEVKNSEGMNNAS